VTFAAAGSLIKSVSTSAFSLTPSGVGDLIIIEIITYDTTVITASGLSSSNVTWTLLGSPVTGSVNAGTAQVFAGNVTSATPATVTITWSGGTPSAHVNTCGQEFSTTTGAWTLDTQGYIDSAGTAVWASLTPAAAGELYFGYALDATAATAGSTPGYTYQNDNNGNGIAYDPACTSSAQAPAWGDSMQNFGIMVLVSEIPVLVPFAAYMSSM
jgi:hypothetical protein